MMKIDILVLGALPLKSVDALEARFVCHHALHDEEVAAILAEAGSRIRGVARGGHITIDRGLIDRLPKLEIVANFGVGYDGIDLGRCAERGIIVTNTPDVLTEEVADTALGLLLMTVRELSAAERHLRAGKWAREGNYPLTPATLRNRTVGIAGLGRIGLAIARRLDAMQVPIVYHARHERPGLPYRYYPDLVSMADAVDILLIVLPGTPETRSAVGTDVLRALGPDGILINIGRGSVVDEPALVEALRTGVIRSAGLDVFVDEPHVPEALIALDNVVLLPHVGSASVFTRNAMGQLMVDNLTSWFDEGRPRTPVPETPWPRKG
jgi:lactate dehydrogenase-like 2-hydroxyacid dehydrogenase